jgi:threonine dehydratase
MPTRPVRQPRADELGPAAAVMARFLPVTPLLASPRLGPGVVLKLETLQPTGSFKVRGALMAVAAARTENPDGAVVTASAGNHGLGVAFAARTFGMRAIVVVPENASAAKLEALAAFDVELVRHGLSYEEAETHALTLAAGGARFVSAYNDPDVIAGQGTLALELFDQVQDLRTIVVPVGGGGLLAGVALAAALRPGVSVWGVEADASRPVSTSVAAGRVVTVPIGPTLADGLAGNIEPGAVTIPVIAGAVEHWAATDEGSIAAAVRFLAFEHGLVVEPSGAVPVAALLSGRLDPGPGPTAVVLTGRNISHALLGELLSGER